MDLVGFLFFVTIIINISLNQKRCSVHQTTLHVFIRLFLQEIAGAGAAAEDVISPGHPQPFP